MPTLAELRKRADDIWGFTVSSLADQGAGIDTATVEKHLSKMVESNTLTARTIAVSPSVNSMQRAGRMLSAEETFEATTYTWLLLRWRSFGYPVFVLSEALTAGLALTDCGNLPANEWRPPFDAMVVQIPKGLLHINRTSTNDRRTVTSILVGSLPVVSPSSVHSDSLRRAEANPSRFLDLCLAADRDGSVPTRHTVRAIPDPVDGWPQVWAHLDQPIDGETFAEWLAITGTKINPDDGTAVGPDDERALSDTWRLSMGLWQYLDSIADRSVPPPLRFSQFQTGKVRTYHVGKEIELPCPRSVLDRIGVSGWNVTSRFMVRGHWRNQAAGVALSERRRTWIRPHWKGPRNPQEVLARTYAVRSP